MGPRVLLAWGCAVQYSSHWPHVNLTILSDMGENLFFLAMPCGLQDLSSLTSDRTCSRSRVLTTTGLPEKPQENNFQGNKSTVPQLC